MSVSVVLETVCRETGESPYWDDRTNLFYFVDNKGQDIHRYNPTTGQDDKIEMDDTTPFILPRKSGGFIVAERRKLIHVDWETKKKKVPTATLR